jgi:Transposase IS116/IS110/IS902 family
MVITPSVPSMPSASLRITLSRITRITCPASLWALEVADPHRFSSIADAVSYCGLTAAFRSSAGKQQRGPISKQRNAWLQTALIEAAKLAPSLESATSGAARSPTGARPPQPRHLASGAKTSSLPAGCGQERPALSATHSASAANHYEVNKEKEKGSSFSASCLRENISPVRDYALTAGGMKTDNATASFLRHADLSPDGHSRPVNTKGNLPSKIPLVTHRCDESGRVFLAGCSSAEPASASSNHSAYQSLYVRSVSDPPAGPCVFGDCARKLRLPLLTTNL